MTEDVLSQRHFPVQCPACGAVAGYPTLVRTVRSKPGYIRIEICCHACDQHWSLDVDTEGQ